MKIVDFRDIDLYPKKYWRNIKDGRERFVIRSLVIEDIERQKDILVAKETHLVLGDAIQVDFRFGHNIAKKGEAEDWIDARVSGVYKVLKIVFHRASNEIELFVNKVE